MVKILEEEAFDTKHKMQAKGQRLGKRRCVKIHFTEELYKKISEEALSREWNFSHMVRHLCEASIEGIE